MSESEVVLCGSDRQDRKISEQLDADSKSLASGSVTKPLVEFALPVISLPHHSTVEGPEDGINHISPQRRQRGVSLIGVFNAELAGASSSVQLAASDSAWLEDSYTNLRAGRRVPDGAIIMRRSSMLVANKFRMCKEDHLQQVKEAALLKKAEEKRKLERLLQATNYKSASAEQRRLLIEHLQSTQASQIWFGVMSSLVFAIRLRRALRREKAGVKLRTILVPVCLRQLRKRRKAVILRKALDSMEFQKPPIEVLKADRMLGYFTEAHLLHSLASLKLRVYLAGEAITYRGIEDFECYMIVKGTAEIRTGPKVVAMYVPGTVVGSLGMVSGEPRTATIYCVTDVFAWVLTKDDFFSFQQDDAYSRQAAIAISELRQKNIVSLYKLQLSSEGLRKFAPLAPASDETLQFVSSAAVSGTLRKGNMIATVGSKPTSVMYVLRGKVVLRAEPGTLPTDRKLIEHVLSVISLPSADSAVQMPHHPHGHADDRRASVSAASHSEHSAVSLGVAEAAVTSSDGVPCYKLRDNIVGEVSGSMLIGLPQIVFMRAHNISVEVSSTAFDCVVFQREGIMRPLASDPLVFFAVKQGLYNYRLPFLPVPSRQALIKTLFPGSLGFDFLQKSAKTKLLSLRPFVIQPGEDVIFDASRGHVGMLLTAGAITEGNARPGHATLWPPPHHLYFGGAKLSTRALSLLEGFYVPRSEYVALIAAFKGVNGETLVSTLKAMWTSTTGRPLPLLEAPATGGSWPSNTVSGGQLAAHATSTSSVSTPLKKESALPVQHHASSASPNAPRCLSPHPRTPPVTQAMLYQDKAPPNMPARPDRSKAMPDLVRAFLGERLAVPRPPASPGPSAVMPFAPHNAPKPEPLKAAGLEADVPDEHAELLQMVRLPVAPPVARARFLAQAVPPARDTAMHAEPLTARARRQVVATSAQGIAQSMQTLFFPTTAASKLVFDSRVKLAAKVAQKLQSSY